jgi:hypothetical protein
MGFDVIGPNQNSKLKKSKICFITHHSLLTLSRLTLALSFSALPSPSHIHHKYLNVTGVNA